MKYLSLLLLLVGVCTTASADYEQGAKAFEDQNYSEAYRHWRVAADNDDHKSQFRLGQLFEQGLGTPQNFIEAHKFYNLAAATGDPEARGARDAVAERMTGEQIARAQDEALAWQSERGASNQPAAEPASARAPAERVANLAWSGISEAELAVLGDEANKLRALLQAGTDSNQVLSTGDTLLLQAVRNSSTRIVDVLLAGGADPSLAGADGWTPLKAAIYGGRTDVARRLLARGADPRDRQPDGLTALALAQRLGHADLIAALSR
jgi:hypothetical protein